IQPVLKCLQFTGIDIHDRDLILLLPGEFVSERRPHSPRPENDDLHTESLVKGKRILARPTAIDKTPIRITFPRFRETRTFPDTQNKTRPCLPPRWECGVRTRSHDPTAPRSA